MTSLHKVLKQYVDHFEGNVPVIIKILFNTNTSIFGAGNEILKIQWRQGNFATELTYGNRDFEPPWWHKDWDWLTKMKNPKQPSKLDLPAGEPTRCFREMMFHLFEQNGLDPDRHLQPDADQKQILRRYKMKKVPVPDGLFEDRPRPVAVPLQVIVEDADQDDGDRAADADQDDGDRAADDDQDDGDRAADAGQPQQDAHPDNDGQPDALQDNHDGTRVDPGVDEGNRAEVPNDGVRDREMSVGNGHQNVTYTKQISPLEETIVNSNLEETIIERQSSNEAGKRKQSTILNSESSRSSSDSSTSYRSKRRRPNISPISSLDSTPRSFRASTPIQSDDSLSGFDRNIQIHLDSTGNIFLETSHDS